MEILVDKVINKFNYKPSLGDVVRIILYPNFFYVADKRYPNKDVSLRIYNEFSKEFRSTVYPVGSVIEIFKHTLQNVAWVTIFNKKDGLSYSVPARNVLEVL